jgi:hypothetical protein
MRRQKGNTPPGFRAPLVSHLRGWIPRPSHLGEPRTLGEHLKKARLDRGIRQRDAAKVSGCGCVTLSIGKRAESRHTFRFWPAIVVFLGYDPGRSPRPLVAVLTSCVDSERRGSSPSVCWKAGEE